MTQQGSTALSHFLAEIGVGDCFRADTVTITVLPPECTPISATALDAPIFGVRPMRFTLEYPSELAKPYMAIRQWAKQFYDVPPTGQSVATA